MPTDYILCTSTIQIHHTLKAISSKLKAKPTCTQIYLYAKTGFHNSCIGSITFI